MGPQSLNVDAIRPGIVLRAVQALVVDGSAHGLDRRLDGRTAGP